MIVLVGEKVKVNDYVKVFGLSVNINGYAFLSQIRMNNQSCSMWENNQSCYVVQRELLFSNISFIVTNVQGLDN